jgi:hypothetical protein
MKAFFGFGKKKEGSSAAPLPSSASAAASRSALQSSNAEIAAQVAAINAVYRSAPAGPAEKSFVALSKGPAGAGSSASGAAGKPSAPLPASAAASAVAPGPAPSAPVRGTRSNLAADIQSIPGNGWCLYNAILYAFRLGPNNKNASNLACAISAWLLKNGDLVIGDSTVNEIYNILKQDGDPIFRERKYISQRENQSYTDPSESIDEYTNRKGFIIQQAAADADAEYARMRDEKVLANNILIKRYAPLENKRKFVETLAQYANDLNTLKTPSNLREGPLLWPDFSIINLALKHIEPFNKYNFKVFRESGERYDYQFLIEENAKPSIYLLFTGGNHYDAFKVRDPAPREAGDHPGEPEALERTLVTALLDANNCIPGVAEGGRRKSIKKHKKRHAKRKTNKRH